MIDATGYWIVALCLGNYDRRIHFSRENRRVFGR